MDQFEYFEKYTSGSLNPNEVAEFEKKLSDLDFKEAYDEYLDMQSFLEAKPAMDVAKVEIKNLRAKHEQAPKKRWLPILSIAATLALVVVCYFLLRSPEPQNSAELYAMYFSPDKMDLNTKSVSENNEVLNEALLSYNQQNYPQAYEKLDTTGVSSKYIPEVLLAKGIAGIASFKLTEGRSLLENLSISDPQFKNDANWYLALSFLKENDIVNAKKYLDMIPQSSNYYEKALVIKGQIERIRDRE